MHKFVDDIMLRNHSQQSVSTQQFQSDSGYSINELNVLHKLSLFAKINDGTDNVQKCCGKSSKSRNLNQAKQHGLRYLKICMQNKAKSLIKNAGT